MVLFFLFQNSIKVPYCGENCVILISNMVVYLYICFVEVDMTGLLALAIIPGIIVLIYVYKKDKIEKEPKKLIWKLVFFGVLSALPAIVFELAGDYLLAEIAGDGLVAMIIENFLVIALSEEICKYFFLKKGTWKNKEFNYRFDAVVYAVSVGMGFAIFENIFYVIENGLVNGIVRALVSIPGHGAFAIAMGIFYGQAKLCESTGDKEGVKKNLRKAVWYPVLMHGFFDFCLTTGSIIMILIFLAYIITMDVIILKRIKQYAAADVRVTLDEMKNVIVTRSIIERTSKVKWLYRREAEAEMDSGWRVFGDKDTPEYVSLPENNIIITFQELLKIEPALLKIYDMEPGSDLQFYREENQTYYIDNKTGERF